MGISQEVVFVVNIELTEAGERAVRMKEECWHSTLGTSKAMGRLQAGLVTEHSLPSCYGRKFFSPAAKLL